MQSPCGRRTYGNFQALKGGWHNCKAESEGTTDQDGDGDAFRGQKEAVHAEDFSLI